MLLTNRQMQTEMLIKLTPALAELKLPHIIQHKYNWTSSMSLCYIRLFISCSLHCKKSSDSKL